jgi:nicotinamidase-related amidase
LSCGERGWAAIPQIAALLRAARAAALPIVYTAGALDETAGLRWRKGPQRASPPAEFHHAPTDIVEEFAPGEGEPRRAQARGECIFRHLARPLSHAAQRRFADRDRRDAQRVR